MGKCNMNLNQLVNYATSRELYTTVFVLIVAFILCFFVRRFFNKSIKAILPSEQNSSRRKMLINILEHGLIYFIFIVTVLVVLQINGVNVTSLIASLGIVSAIVGLALQDWLKDIIMGIHIVFDHFFDVDDVIEYDGIEGRVIDFNIKTTKMCSVVDDSIITICNRNISQIRVVSPVMNIDVEFDYDVSEEIAEDIMNIITEKSNKLNNVNEASYLGIQAYGDSSIAHRMRVVCDTSHSRFTVRRQINTIIRQTFDDGNITIPYNQLDVHMK